MENNFDMSFNDIMLKYSLTLEMLETELRVIIKNYEYNNKCNPVDHIKSRLKSKSSIENKLRKKQYEITTDNMINHIHDIIGIRIVCSFLSDVYDIVNLIKSSNRFTIKEEKDYIKKPKSTGYISYHLILLVPVFLDDKEVMMEAEIQIRTMAMDFWASLDHKLTYKFDEIPEEVKNEMFNCSTDIKKLDERMNQLNKVVDKYRKPEV